MQLRREAAGLVLRVVIDRPDPGLPSSIASRASEGSRDQAAGGAGILRGADGTDAAGGPGAEEESIGVADCQRVSHDLSALLDVEEDELGEAGLSGAYTLEVSSPGLDRPLRHEADYRRFAGRLAKVVTATPIDGQSAFAGRIAGVENGVVLLQEGRTVHRVPVGSIKRGRLEVEF